jgi:hypothetical protein
MKDTQKSIVRALLYFDIFSHPLSTAELYDMISMHIGQDEFERDLEDLRKSGTIRFDSGYFLIPNGHSPIPQRIRKQERADSYRRIARWVSGIIYRHPFVRAVLISGSLSKRAFSEKDDIDFFIITRTGRLWVSRILLMLFKKIFLLNSKKYFCINYFIDEESLEIPEKNIFTATEIAYLIPLKNSDLCSRFFEANSWIRSYFPNWNPPVARGNPPGDPFLKKSLEKILDGNFGNRLDSYFMELYSRRNKKKFRQKDRRNFDLNFKTARNVAKHHPNGFQEIILSRFTTKIREFEASHEVDLSV